MKDTREKCSECNGRGIDPWGGTCLRCGGQGRQPFRGNGEEADEYYADCQHYGIGYCIECGMKLPDAV